MSTHEVYCSLDICKLLKEAGFDWKCIRYYQNDDETLYGPLVEQYKLVETNFNVAPVYMDQYSAPTIEVAQRWLREVKRIFISISSGLREHMVYDCKVVDWRRDYNENYYVNDAFNTYEEALEAGIKKALEIILEKGK